MQTWLQDLMAALGTAKRHELAGRLGMDPAMITYMERRGITLKGFDAMQRAAKVGGIDLPESVRQAYLERPSRAGNARSAA